MIKNMLLSLSLLAVGMSYAVAEDVTGTYVAGSRL